MVELSMVTTHPVVELSSGTSEPIKISNFNLSIFFSTYAPPEWGGT